MDRFEEEEGVGRMKCLVCHWKMVNKKVTVDLRIGDELGGYSTNG